MAVSQFVMALGGKTYVAFFQGTDISDYVDFRTLNIEDNIGIKSDTMSFEMVIPNWVITRPLSGQPIYLEEWEAPTEDGFYVFKDLVFGGIIEKVRQYWVAPPHTFRYRVDCSDWIKVMDRQLVTRDYDLNYNEDTKESYGVKMYPVNQPEGFRAVDIVRNIIADFTHGFAFYPNDDVMTRNLVSPDACLFDHEEVSSCISKMAEAADCQWYIDGNRVVRYFWKEILSSPLPGNMIDLDTDLSKYGDFEITEDASQVKNKIFVLDAGSDASPWYRQTDVFYGRGTFWKLSQPIIQPKLGRTVISRSQIYTAEIRERLTGTIRRVLDDVRVVGVEGRNYWGTTQTWTGQTTPTPAWPADTSSTIYVDADQQQISISTNHPLGWTGPDGTWSDDQELIFEYPPVEEVPCIEVDYNSAGLMAGRLGDELTQDDQDAGYFEYVISKPDTITADVKSLATIAQYVLQRSAKPILSGSFYSRVPGWRCGQKFRVESNKWEYIPGYAKRLYQEVYVNAVSISFLDHHTLNSVIKFTSSPFGQ